VDWATVASGAITGVVGIAGVAGTILAAKIAGNSATENARLGISAESDRARLAEKRRIYARAIAAVDAGFLAARSAVSADRAAYGQASTASDEANLEAAARLREATAEWKAGVETATFAVTELQLIAPLPVGELARTALISLSDQDPNADARNALLKALRVDLDQEAQQSTPPE
jgi:hypothetical protein